MKKRILSILLCLALVAGVLPLAAPAVFAQENDIANGDYSSWNKAYVATDSGGLEKVFNKERTKDTTVYIKLGKDISYSGLDDDIYNRSGLSAKGGDIHLDLCGYNLTYSKDFNFIKGDTGRVYIYDSQRYDQSKGKWISGKPLRQARPFLRTFISDTGLDGKRYGQGV